MAKHKYASDARELFDRIVGAACHSIGLKRTNRRTHTQRRRLLGIRGHGGYFEYRQRQRPHNNNSNESNGKQPPRQTDDASLGLVTFSLSRSLSLCFEMEIWMWIDLLRSCYQHCTVFAHHNGVFCNEHQLSSVFFFPVFLSLPFERGTNVKFSYSVFHWKKLMYTMWLYNWIDMANIRE